MAEPRRIQSAMVRESRYAVAILLSVAGSACGGSAHARPIEAQARPVTQSVAPRCQVVFFPGLGDSGASFESFRDSMVERRIHAETLALPNRDYGTDDFSERLHRDVVEPSLSRGIGDVWLVAVSMGSAPALRFASTYPDDVRGIVLIAPAMGGPFLVKRVHAVGGPRFLDADEGDRDERAVRWLVDRSRSDGSTVEVRLAYGRQDALAPFAEALASVLPDDHVLIGAGGHDWTVWEELWTALLDTGFFQQSCGAERGRGAL